MVRKRRGYKQYEARLIQLLRWRFEKAKLKVDDHLKVGKLPLEIDLIVNRRVAQKTRGSFSLPRLFEYFKRYNVMELKTEQDPLTLGDLLKLQAYTWLYMQKHKIYAVAEVTATAIVHHLTPAVMAALPALGYKPAGRGIFRCESAFLSYLIAIEDLPDELAPEELQVFSNPVRRQRVFLSCLGKGAKKTIMDTLIDLYESAVIKLMAPLNIRPESMPKFIKALGKEKVIAALSKKDILAALSQDDVIAAMGEKETLKALLAKLGRKRLHKMIDQINRNDAAKKQSTKSRAN